jgi:Domain of unknown function (DUF397)
MRRLIRVSKPIDPNVPERDDEKADWIRSQFCAAGECVELKWLRDGVALRNSTQADNVLTFSLEEWHVFVRGIQEGEFDRR